MDLDGRWKQGGKEGTNCKSNGGRHSKGRNKASKTSKCVYKQVRFGEEQQLEKTEAENAGESEVMGRTTEVRTGRGRAGLVPGGDESRELNETSRKGKGKGNGGKGEHEGKGGGFGHKGREEERVRMSPNMGAGGSHPQATSDPGKEEKGNKETRVLSWADCNDEETKENEEEVKEEKETGQREMTDERPPGLEEVEREPKTQGEEQSQVESEQGAQEEESRRAREEQKRAQEAREEERRAREAREEEEKAKEAREEEKAQEMRRQKRVQEAREEEAKAQEEREKREVEAQGVLESDVKAQEGREGEVKAQDEREEDANSMHEESHVSNRHMSWWQNAWWVRVNNGLHLRTARDRRKVRRAATRAAQEVRETGEVAGREREEWEKRETGRRESNTLQWHVQGWCSLLECATLLGSTADTCSASVYEDFWTNFTLFFVKGGLSDPEVDSRPSCCKLLCLCSCSSSLSSTSLSWRTGRLPCSLRFSSCSTMIRWSMFVVQVQQVRVLAARTQSSSHSYSPFGPGRSHARCVQRQMPMVDVLMQFIDLGGRCCDAAATSSSCRPQ